MYFQKVNAWATDTPHTLFTHPKALSHTLKTLNMVPEGKRHTGLDWSGSRAPDGWLGGRPGTGRQFNGIKIIWAIFLRYFLGNVYTRQMQVLQLLRQSILKYPFQFDFLANFWTNC